MKKYFFIALGVFGISGCMEQFYATGTRISIAIKKYRDVESQINLGDSKHKVLRTLLPIQTILTPDLSKVPDRYRKKGVLVEIYYIRSGWLPDGLKTNDEFTPYVFNDNKLVGIGWHIISTRPTYP